MSNNDKLENLEFFDSFLDTDPIDSDPINYDPNQNLAPDILNGEKFDPLKGEEDDDLPDLPKDPAPNNNDVVEDPLDDDLEDDNDSDPVDNDDDNDDDDETPNDFEIFAKGLAQAR